MSAPRKIVKRIAALLRTAKNGEDDPDDAIRHEASVAQAMADRLMSRYNVEVDLDALDEGLRNPLFSERMVMFLRRREDSMWAQFLLQQVAPLYWCTNKQLEVDVGWTFYVVGSQGNLEPCAIHFEYLRRKIELISGALFERLQARPRVPGTLVDPLTGSFGRPVGPAERDAVCWGVMEAMLRNLSLKAADRKPAGPPPGAGLDIVKMDLLALPAAGEQMTVRGNEIAIGGEFGRGDGPEEIDAPEPPRWAFIEGFRSVSIDEDPEPPEIVFRPVRELEVPGRVAESLSACGVHTVAQLVRMRPSQVVALDGLSEYDVVELVHALGAHGLFFPPDWEVVA